MLDVTETAHDGCALSIPQVNRIEALPYLAIRVSGPMTLLPEFAPPRLPELHSWMAVNGKSNGGKAFFRYLGFGPGGTVDLEVGTTTLRPETGGGNVIAGEIPAGSYACATHSGPYDRLHDSFLMLNGWMRGRGLVPDDTHGKDGERLACQLEIYRVSPAQESDPANWQTDLMIRLKD